MPEIIINPEYLPGIRYCLFLTTAFFLMCIPIFGKEDLKTNLTCFAISAISFLYMTPDFLKIVY